MNLAALGLFKYADFAVGTLNSMVGSTFALPGLALRQLGAAIGQSVAKAVQRA